MSAIGGVSSTTAQVQAAKAATEVKTAQVQVKAAETASASPAPEATNPNGNYCCSA